MAVPGVFGLCVLLLEYWILADLITQNNFWNSQNSNNLGYGCLSGSEDLGIPLRGQFFGNFINSLDKNS